MSKLDEAWAPYVPSRELPWNLRRVVHLHRRAGFAATWQELQRDLADGPGTSVDRLLKSQARSNPCPRTSRRSPTFWAGALRIRAA
ncbi:MAG TPA: hypothetical protein VGY66_20985 [Gemmataceae bacterium]|nr:hypothetical protein [Gemmataceae bacterium]